MDSLAHLLRRAAAQVVRAQAIALEPHGVTPAEWSVLRALHDFGAVAPSGLADACGLTRGAVTRLVDRLRAKRLVVRAAAGRADRRYQTIALTGAGATSIRLLAAATDAAEKTVFAALSQGDRAALSRGLARLV